MNANERKYKKHLGQPQIFYRVILAYCHLDQWGLRSLPLVEDDNNNITVLNSRSFAEK